MQSSSTYGEESSFGGMQSAAGRTGTVQRPEPGLARGRWEAPAWVFWAVALVTGALALTWALLAMRAWLLRRKNHHGRRPR